MHRGAMFELRDCDADGIPDPTCTDSRGRFGVLQSSKGCEDSWPQGECKSRPGNVSIILLSEGHVMYEINKENWYSD